MARGILVSEFDKRWVAAAVALIGIACAGAMLYFMISNGDVLRWPETMVYIYYAIIATICLLCSPLITLVLMRTAGYKMSIPAISRTS